MSDAYRFTRELSLRKKKEELWAARLSNCSVGATFALSFRLNKPQHLLFAIINRRFG